MNARTFIGLIILIAALFVASVPELLDPTARGLEQAAVKVGALDPDPAKAQAAKAEAKAKADEPDPDELAEPRLALKGFVVEEDGDLRDSVDPAERESFRRGRLTAGASRTRLPGQQEPVDEQVPPAAAEDGVLLDITGCPVFRSDTDVAALLADPDMVDLYAAKVEESDDPEACDLLLQERIAEATIVPAATPLGATTARERAAIRRGGAMAMIIGLSELELMASFMDDEQLQEALAALEGEPPAAAAAGAAAAPAAAPAAG